METGDSSKCDPDTVFSSLSRDMLNHELPSLSPVSTVFCEYDIVVASRQKLGIISENNASQK